MLPDFQSSFQDELSRARPRASPQRQGGATELFRIDSEPEFEVVDDDEDEDEDAKTNALVGNATLERWSDQRAERCAHLGEG